MFSEVLLWYAQVVKLVDTSVLGTDAARLGGSSPLLGTKTFRKSQLLGIFSFCETEHVALRRRVGVANTLAFSLQVKEKDLVICDQNVMHLI